MSLDNRAWLLWGIAISTPAIIGRNPFVLLELLLITATVHALAGSTTPSPWAARVLAVFALIGVTFNVLTVHSGDRVMARLPDCLPIIGGRLTVNALLYGVVSALAFLVVLLAWLLVAAQLRWTMLLRQLPERFADLAVASSVAWSYVPGMRQTLRDIREAQYARGLTRLRARHLPALVVPLLAGGLERAMITAEVLETRGFGARAAAPSRSIQVVVLPGGLIAITTGLYCLAAGFAVAATLLCVAGVALILLDHRLERQHQRSQGSATSLRDVPWSGHDSLVVVTSGIALLLTVVVAAADPGVMVFDPYPTIDAPLVHLPLLACLLLLFTPAVIAAFAPPAP